jgi:UDP-N-acetylmuramoyl-L-alanyl-D-glutamate--2,6-diaminopimelate ligase
MDSVMATIVGKAPAETYSKTGRSVRLSDLAVLWPEGIASTGPLPADPVLIGITDDSRQVRSGWLFVAVKGISSDGHAYIPKAIEAGAAAVLCEHLEDGAANVPHMVVRDTRKALGLLLSRFYNLADACRTGRFKILGVTGTNGKTTSAYLMQHLLNATNCRCGRITTIDRDLGNGQALVSNNTTPPATALYADLATAIDRNCAAVAMEVSSHGLDQHRVAGLSFAVAVFTNLTRDHLDYHGDMNAYAAAKARLFAGLAPAAAAIVNVDDPYWKHMIVDCKARVLRYSLKNPDAEVFGLITHCDAAGLRMTVHAPAGAMDIHSHLVGRHNAQNILASIGAALALGLEPPEIARGVAGFRSAPGRLEPVARELDLPFRVVVDYAHTDDAMRNVLEALRPLTQGCLCIVFGCGGDRDRTKRPLMGRTAVDLADRVFVTSDNPRTEQPDAIISEILAGIPADRMSKVTVDPDRARAIRSAIDSAAPGDVILLAGKGHEDYQIIGRQKRPFDDRLIAAAAMRNHTER